MVAAIPKSTGAQGIGVGEYQSELSIPLTHSVLPLQALPTYNVSRDLPTFVESSEDVRVGVILGWLITTLKHLFSTHIKIKGVCLMKALKFKYTGENTVYPHTPLIAVKNYSYLHRSCQYIPIMLDTWPCD